MTVDPLQGGRCSCVPVIDRVRAAIDGEQLEPTCQLHEADAIAAWKAERQRADAIDHLARVEKIYDDLRPKKREPEQEPRPSTSSLVMDAIAVDAASSGVEWPTPDQLPARGVRIGSAELNAAFAGMFPGAATDFSTHTD